MTPISTLIREQSREVHEEAESSSLMTAIATGQVSIGEYAALLGQLRWVYEALDAGAELRREMPEFSTVFDARLDRRESIARDLLALGVQEDPPTAATRAYANRIAEVAQSWPLGLLAHHYTRYMGDLSGGRILGSALRANLALTPEQGL
ncbi:MAG: biliverdin-producing heme oxygenase, partial [Actinomycetota bacterium]|nr:biliverdin-producing heme oxygenase [Actinomycetota bacterium]